MRVSELAEGEAGTIGPWNLWRDDADGQWYVDGDATVSTSATFGAFNAVGIRREGGVYLVDASRVAGYGFAYSADLLGSGVASLPCSVSTEVEEVAAAGAAARLAVG
jgi:hypothetical protein